MKKLIFTTALLVAAVPLPTGTNPDAQQLLIAAKQQANLVHDNADPFQLDVDFSAQMQVPAQGHLTLKWKAKDQWWRRIIMGDFEQIDIRNGDRLYTTRNASFTPVRIKELFSLVQFAEPADGLRVKKQRHRVENGIQVTCLQIEGEDTFSRRHEICVNPGSREILTDDRQEPPDERRREQYSEYFDFRTQRYPRKLELFVNGSRVLSAQVNHLKETTFDPTLLVVPRGAIERRQCENMKHAVPVRTPDPPYPVSASQNRLMGDTIVSMTVLTDGSVDNIQLVGSATRAMDDATLQTLKSWRFKPAMCGAEPVVSDIRVVVSFRLR
jgi:TonB family protein